MLDKILSFRWVNFWLTFFGTIFKSQQLAVEYSEATLPNGSDCHRLHYDGQDSIYIFGDCPRFSLNPILKYSLELDTISKIGSLPTIFSRGTIQSDMDGNLLFFGADLSDDKVIRYDIERNNGSIVATLPWNIFTHPSIISKLQNTVFILGGYGISNLFKIISFDLETYEITELPNRLQIDLDCASAIRVGDRVFIFPFSTLGNGSVWELDLNSLEMTPVSQPNTLPFLTPLPSLVTDGNVIFAIAGFQQNQHPTFTSYEGILHFDPETNSTNFVPVDNWPVKDGNRYFKYPPQCVYVEKLERVYCFGGMSASYADESANKYLDDIFYIDIRGVTLATWPPTQQTTEQTTEELATISEGNEDWKLIVIVCLSSGFLILVSLGIIYKIKKNASRNNAIDKMYRDFKYGVKNGQKPYPLDEKDEANYYQALENPFPSSLEISPQRLKCDENFVLGKGAYGIVLQGTLDEKKLVAVKTVGKNVNQSALAALLSEVKIMNYVGKHPNIVQLLGVQIFDLKKGLIFVALEFCSVGSLESVLQKKKAQLQTESGIYQIPGYFTDFEERKPFSTDNLLKFCLQACSAMEFLGSKGIVHGDLATRNVLLDGNYTAKISDFGLSRQIYDYKKYATAEKDTALPWRWLAIETLHTYKFSHASDCWAFGVFMWEVFSLADLPYSAAVHWSSEFIRFLESGSRLKCPKYATDEIFGVMNLCWDANPARRPSFHQISIFLSEILEKECGQEMDKQQLC